MFEQLKDGSYGPDRGALDRVIRRAGELQRARRRRLAAASSLAAVVLAVGGVALLGDDDPTGNVATVGRATTPTSVRLQPPPASGQAGAGDLGGATPPLGPTTTVPATTTTTTTTTTSQPSTAQGDSGIRGTMVLAEEPCRTPRPGTCAKPVPGEAWVRRQGQATRLQTVDVAQDGRFVFRLDAGSYVVEGTAEGGTRCGPVEIEVGAEWTDVNLRCVMRG